MGSTRVPLLVGVAVVGTTVLTATALGAVTMGGGGPGRVEMAARVTSSLTRNGVEIKAAAGAPRIAAGTSVPLTVTVRSEQTQMTVVDLEAYDPSGRRVYQKTWSGLTLTGGQAATWTLPWKPPTAPGRYRVAVGVFTEGWGSLLAWNAQAAFVVVVPAAARAASPTSAAAGPATDTEADPGWTSPAPTQAAPGGVTPHAGVPAGSSAQPADGAVPADGTDPYATQVTDPGLTGTVPDGPPPKHFATVPPDGALPTSEQCAGWVRALPTPAEIKGVNASPNRKEGKPLKGATGLLTRVDGAFTGTTEQIIRWTACKWGIDEDIVKAQVATESWWRMDTKGDWGSDPAACPPGHGLGVDGKAGMCPQSFGLMQVRFPFHRIAYPGALTSSALNLDYAYSQWRDCYVGNQTWLNTVDHGLTYTPGDEFGCVGVWFAGRWHTQPAEDYIKKVKGYLAKKVWTTAAFRQP